jgi:UDP-2,3-diacylglucosamine hydrolase
MASGQEAVKGNEVSELPVFLADVHLRREELAKRDALIGYLGGISRVGVHLYLLGDLFNTWIGQAQLEDEPELVPVFEAMKVLVRSGAKLTFFHGNRDYCIGNDLTRTLGAETVRYSKVIDLGGKKTLLTHGDLLSTGDQLYHLARFFMRGPISGLLFRLLPTPLKYGIVSGYRGISERRDPVRRKKRHGIHPAKVHSLMRRGVELIICGHVHEHRERTYRHRGRELRLITLPQWETEGAALEYSDGKFTLKAIDFA